MALSMVETATLPAVDTGTNLKPVQYVKVSTAEKAAIQSMLQSASVTNHVDAIKEHRKSTARFSLSDHHKDKLPHPQLNRMSSETREINELVKMVTGEATTSKEEAREKMRTRRKSKFESAGSNAASPTAESGVSTKGDNQEVHDTCINERIREAHIKGASSVPQGRVTRVGRKSGFSAVGAMEITLERRLAWRRAFEKAKEELTETSSASHPNIKATCLKRDSSGCCDDGPNLKRGSSSSNIVTITPVAA